MDKYSFIPFLSLTTERTILRRLTTEDEPEIFMLRSNDRVNEFLERPKMLSIGEGGQFIQKINNGIDSNEWLYWAIVLKDQQPVMGGTICLWNFSGDRSVAEIGYELRPDLHGKGIMKEVISIIIELGFHQLKLKTLMAYVHPGNEKSIQLLKKFNFQRNSKHLHGGVLDNHVAYVLNV